MIKLAEHENRRYANRLPRPLNIGIIFSCRWIRVFHYAQGRSRTWEYCSSKLYPIAPLAKRLVRYESVRISIFGSLRGPRVVQSSLLVAKTPCPEKTLRKSYLR